ncbi:hypothetical protein KUH32_02680 [Thalassococcus sp. CAU 1522]|uniref:pEK499-p136 HEPN domain-containing protein n=1 Tax=Thalassococcus arenae TaxID=2851652 RepID=A0ABS6N550_9RHOB|nr:hypothetical protein [Thalassococcus arenae]MBV2358665.1 hypothetical protein [Thalassococcus arenae]
MSIPFENLDIPTAAVLEHEVIFKAFENGYLRRCADELCELKGIDVGSIPTPPYRQVRYLSLLYCLLVFPRELSKGSEAFAETLEIVSKDEKFRAISGEKPAEFLRLVRNSISHARLRFEETGIRFEDRARGQKHFDKLISYQDVDYVLTTLHNIYNTMRHPELREIWEQRTGE